MATFTERNLQERWSGASAMTIWMVEQFGFATNRTPASSAWPFISGTTSGTSGSLRKALELSTTTLPAATNRGAHSRATLAPAEKSARSTGSKVFSESAMARTLVP